MGRNGRTPGAADLSTCEDSLKSSGTTNNGSNGTDAFGVRHEQVSEQAHATTQQTTERSRLRLLRFELPITHWCPFGIAGE